MINQKGFADRITEHAHVRDLYDYALQKGFRKKQFISADNAREFIDTTVDAYDGYPL